ncbi:MAG: hypothetical protein IIB00_05105 [candidate division Zixibacteria bacterium]|nr:hypothetical protein [candidate division Zixibacteria bacterium]
MRLSTSALIISSLTTTSVLSLIISCSTDQERLAEFSGTLIYSERWTYIDTAGASLPTGFFLSEQNGYIYYDREIDGEFDDSTPVFTSESGEFEGLLIYDSPLELRAAWIRKPVRLVFESLNIDTVLFVDAYLPGGGATESDFLTDWGAILIPQTDDDQVGIDDVTDIYIDSIADSVTIR